MRKHFRVACNPGSFAIVVTLALIVCAPEPLIAAEPPTSNQLQPSDTVPIEGKIVFWQTSNITTPVTGRIASLPVRVGDHVKQGDIVAEIDTQQLKANLAVAQSDVLNAQSALKVAEAQLALETTTRDRLAKLKQSPSFSAANLEDANNRVLVASANVEAAKTLIQAKQAEVARQQVNVNLATIRAPFNALVVKQLLTVGGLVSDYQPSILILVDDSSPEIEAEVPVEYVSNIRVGMPMAYSANSGARQAKVRAVLPNAGPDAKTRTVLLDPENEGTTSFSDVQPVTVYVPKN
jgi:membrane fusion protein, multidrug efflux system